MKKTFYCVLLTLLSFTVLADDHHGHHRHHDRYYDHHSRGDWWVAPAIVGGAAAITYGITQPYFQSQPAVPYGYHYESLWDYNCSCYRTVLIPN